MIRLLFIILFIPEALLANLNFGKDLSFETFDEDGFKKSLSKAIFEDNGWPENHVYNEREYDVEYTINDQLTNYIIKELKRYRSDYTSVVVLDNNTGAILSAVDLQRKGNKVGKSMAFSSAHPAASVFKVITAADLLDNTEVNKETKFSYNGRSTTLYKYQLKDK